jgi:uncharacterized protein YbjT (DUF2867 family)
MPKEKVLILGAGGAIAHHVIGFLQHHKNIELTLFARDKGKLRQYESPANVIEGDALAKKDLDTAVKGQNIVYANLSGSVDKMAKAIVSSMTSNGVQRLIFIASLGIYKEIPGKFGEWTESMIGPDLVPYRKAADIIESSGLDYTIVRPTWLTDKDEVDYETTQKGEPVRGTEVSRKAVAAYISDIIMHPGKDKRSSVGVNKPGVYGDKPSFY